MPQRKLTPQQALEADIWGDPVDDDIAPHLAAALRYFYPFDTDTIANWPTAKLDELAVWSCAADGIPLDELGVDDEMGH